MLSIKHPENEEKRMKKFQNFKWQMWHVHRAIVIVFLLTVLFWTSFYAFYYNDRLENRIEQVG